MARTHSFTVTVEGCTAEQADTVMGGRLGYDEECYDDNGDTFDYQIEGWKALAGNKGTHNFLVSVTCYTKEQAERVMAERLGYDEEYYDEDNNTFDYTIAEWGEGESR